MKEKEDSVESILYPIELLWEYFDKEVRGLAPTSQKTPLGASGMFLGKCAAGEDRQTQWKDATSTQSCLEK